MDKAVDLPTLMFVCSKLGAPSEVWLYRQATQMQHHRVRVVAWDYQDREKFPPVNCDVTLVPPELHLPRPGLKRTALRLLNMARGHFGSTVGETAWFREQIREKRPDVILGQFGHVSLRVAPAARAEGVPMVIHFHGVDLSGLLRSWNYRTSLQRAIPHIERFVIVAEYMRPVLVGMGADPERIERIPCGVPMRDFSPSTGVDAADCRFLMVGRLTEKKRPDLSLRAFAATAEVFPSARLIVIGDGELMVEMWRIINENRLVDRVELLATQPPERVREEMRRASVFVQHSVTASDGSKEGWPVAIAEAAASGLPIVATRHASIPEQVEHEVSGLLCEEGDWQTMAEYMKRLAGDVELRRRMGAASRERIAAYDTSRQIASLEEVLCKARTAK